MTLFGSSRASDSSNVREPGQGDSLQMIPVWSMVLAVAVFLGSMYFFNRAPASAPPRPASNPATAASSSPSPASASTPSTATAQAQRRPQQRGPGQLAGRLMFSYTTGAALATYVLLVGYVSRDVKRRHMSAPLWMLIVLVMPGGIGAIVYFLLRQPIMVRCPHCTTELTEGVHFCPQCQFQVAPVCGRCFRGVQITDVYCAQCGHDVAEDHAPARLRAYSDT